MADKTSIMKDAQKYLSKGQIDRAISEWEKLVKVSPDGNTFNIIGDLYLKKGNKKLAIESFCKAANFFRQEGFSLKALALYKKAMNIDSTDTNALYALGELSEEKGLITDATKYYLAMADSMAKAGEKDKILDIYEKILSLSPANIPLRNKVAEIFLKEGLKSDASKEYVYIARIYDEKGDTQRSKEYYQKVLDIQPLNKKAVLGLSFLYEKTGDLKSAIEHIKEATALFPEDVEVILRCAELSLIGGYAENAKDYLNKIIEKEPANIKSRRLLGEIYLKDGLKEKAWAEYLPVIDALIIEGKYEDALKLLEFFKEVDLIETSKRLISLYRQTGENDRLSAELLSLGDALNERGMNEDALSCYKEALEMRPDDKYLKERVAEIVKEPEVEKKAVTDHISIKVEKTLDEVFTEADIFSRYGLLSEAKRLLEGLKQREPENIDLHMRLKSIYMDTFDKEAAVTECLILNELFKRLGDIENVDKILKDAYEIYPEDPRLKERAEMSLFEATSYAAASEKGELTSIASGEPNIEDYGEEIAEADFYARQGLIQEAVKILEKLHRLFPNDSGISEKLASLGQTSGEIETSKIPEAIEVPGVAFKDAATGETIPGKGVTEGIVQQPEEGEYEDLMFTDQDLVEAEEMPEPELDSDVLEIFQEFKKGLEKELDDEDSETHYNLGIAYKEMGLIDDAIKEFQTAKDDPKRLIQSLTMLGVCYIEKGLYPLAIKAMNNVIKDADYNDESYWAIKYDLAEAYEKNKNLKEALDLYTDVYSRDAKFRSVSEKLNQLRAQLASTAKLVKPKEKKDRVSYL